MAQMFELLLWDCFAGCGKIEGEGIEVVVCPDPGKSQTTLALKLDNKAFRTVTNTAGPLCDGLFLGLDPPVSGKEGQAYLLFVELKGRDTDHAVKQIESALRIFRDHLQSTLSESTAGRTRFSAVIVSDRASHSSVPKDIAIRFSKEFKSRIHVVSARRNGPPVDLSDYLWRRQVPSPTPAASPPPTDSVEPSAS